MIEKPEASSSGQLSAAGDSMEEGSMSEETGGENGSELVSEEDGWANAESESEDEMDHASLYEEEMESEEESLEGDEKEEESARCELPTLLAEEKAVQGWKVDDRAMEGQDSAISQWSIRETRDLMGDESMDENE